MNSTMVQIKFIDKDLYSVKEEGTGKHIGFTPPLYATQGAAAFDLVAAERAIIAPGQVYKIRTGIAIHLLNDACAGMILPRSGLGSKGLILGNTVGLIDSDYQGELVVNAWNRNGQSGDTIAISRGERIAQLVIVPVLRAEWQAVEEFTVETDRGAKGFGSTGVV